MKKTFLFLGFLAFLSSCSQVGTRLLPYPEGIVFPVEQSNGIVYEGEITGEIFQKGEFFFFFDLGRGDSLSGKQDRQHQVDLPIGGATHGSFESL